jgi:hypothetical protein
MRLKWRLRSWTLVRAKAMHCWTNSWFDEMNVWLLSTVKSGRVLLFFRFRYCETTMLILKWRKSPLFCLCFGLHDGDFSSRKRQTWVPVHSVWSSIGMYTIYWLIYCVNGANKAMQAWKCLTYANQSKSCNLFCNGISVTEIGILRNTGIGNPYTRTRIRIRVLVPIRVYGLLKIRVHVLVDNIFEEPYAQNNGWLWVGSDSLSLPTLTTKGW